MSIVVFDFETGGVKPEQPNIQLAAIAVDDEWNEIGTFERKIEFNPDDCDPDALKLNHYSAETWDNAAPVCTVFDDFCDFLNKHKTVEMTSKRTGKPYKVARLAAYNATFDKDRLWAMANGQFVPAHPQALCIMQLAMWAVVGARLKVDNLKLGTVAAALDIEPLKAHDALSDVRTAAAVARKLLKR